MANPNLDLLTDAAKLLGPLLGELVIVGGCATALLITDKAAADVRPTLMWMRLRKSRPMLDTKVLNKLFSGFEGKLTRDKWMKITKTSSRTALRDIEELIAAGVIEQEEAGGRSTSYRLNRAAKGSGQD